MPCYHPLTAYRAKSGHSPTTGKWQITFNVKEGYADKTVMLPCGRCIGCRLERSRQWAIRIMHESHGNPDCSFITLTYSDLHLPPDNSLNKRDIQLFFKRLRKKYGNNIRYYQCGEYGEKFQRPHHHACLFNIKLDDLRHLYTTKDGYKYYESDSIEKIWGKGNIIVSDLTFESAAYVSRYCTKKITGKNAQSHYGKRLPEYATMSRRTALGKEFFNKFKDDIIVGDSVIIRKGLICKPAKYYDKLYDSLNPKHMERIKRERQKMAMSNEDYHDYRRLEVKEKIKMYKNKQLKRSYEDGNATICN